MKNTYVECKDWSWEDKLLYIKACVGDDIPHNKLCGFGCEPKEIILNSYKNEAAFLICSDRGMISYDDVSARGVYPNHKLVKLSSLKPRTKVEYERCEFDHAWQAVKEHEESKNIFHCNESGEYPICGYDMHIIGECVRDGEIYRKVERPIEWHEDAIEFAQQCKGVNTAVYIPEYDAIDIDGSMTREEACDYARILLEQEGE